MTEGVTGYVVCVAANLISCAVGRGTLYVVCVAANLISCAVGRGTLVRQNKTINIQNKRRRIVDVSCALPKVPS